MSIYKKINEYARLAKAFSEGRWHRRLLFIKLLWVPIGKRLYGRRPIPLSLVVAPGRRIAWSVRDGTDIAALRAVVVGGEYEVPEARSLKPKHIADIGAHIGSASLFFCSRLSGCKGDRV